MQMVPLFFGKSTMENLVVSQELQAKGLNEDIVLKALRINENHLQKCHLAFCLVPIEKSKNGSAYTFWTIQAFLNHSSQGITVGMSGRDINEIDRTIAGMKNAAANTGKLLGVWPKPQMSFLQWLQKELKRKKIFIPFQDPLCLRSATARGQDQLPNLNQSNERDEVFYQKQIEKSAQQRLVKWLKWMERWQKSFPSIDKELALYRQNRAEFSISEQTTLDQAEKSLQCFLELSRIDFSSIVSSVNQVPGGAILSDNTNNPVLKIKGDELVEYRGTALPLPLHKARFLVFTSLKSLANRKKKRILTQLLLEMPLEWKNKIESIQHEFKKHQEKSRFLSSQDEHFLKNYGTTKLDATQIKKVENQQQMLTWIREWGNRVIQVMAQSTNVDVDREILGLIASTPKFGLKTYANWLKDTSSKYLKGKRLDPKFKGRLQHYTLAFIVDELEALKEHGFLELHHVGSYDLPVLILSPEGRKKLEFLKTQNANSMLELPADIDVFPEIPKQSKKVVIQPSISQFYFQMQLLQGLEVGNREGWVKFLEQITAIQEIETWEETAICNIRDLLDQKMEGWRALARWQLAKHPVKYKPLQRLLLKKEEKL